MKIGFYCYDNAGGDAMKLFAEAAKRFGHQTVLFPKQVPGHAINHATEMFDCNAVVTGLSSFQTHEELDFLVSLPPKVKWMIFEDVPGASCRPLVRERNMAGRASAVILASPTGEKDARLFGYECPLVYLGPPPQWRKDYEALIAARTAKMRLKLNQRKGLGVASFEWAPLSAEAVVVGLIGGKDPAENNRVIGIVLEAIEGTGWMLAFGKHPGEKAERKPGMSDEEFEREVARFERLFAEQDQMFDGRWIADTSDTKVWSGPTIAGVADVMVYFSGTNISAAGAIAQMPQVHLDDEGVRRRLAGQTGGDGSWFVADLGGALKAKSASEVNQAIQTLLTSEGREELAKKQAEAFPLPDDWNTEAKIARFLETLV